MREILFRAYDKGRKEYLSDDNLFIAINNSRYPSKSEIYLDVISNADKYKERFVIEQYTGLTDKNDKRIFEGDICRFREWSRGDMCWIGKVHYEHQQFVISGGKNKECDSWFTLVMSRFISENIEVIGNIHDNPELLKGGDE